MIKVILKKNKYYLFLNNQIMFSQEIIKSKNIPNNISPKVYWFMYVLLIASKFGLVKSPK